MRYFVLLLILIGFVVTYSQYADGMCVSGSDWDKVPCWGRPCSGNEPACTDPNWWKEQWVPYYDYKGAEWMNQKKIELLDAIKTDTLAEWKNRTPNGTNSNVHDYYFYMGEVPNHNGIYVKQYFAGYFPPLKQIKSGITIDQIQCKEGFAVVIKKSNGIPNCVKHETLEKLRERGWAEPLGNIISQRPSQSKPEPTLTPHSEPEPDYNFDKTFTLIGKKSKYNLDYLMPSGTITDIQLDCNSLQLVLSVSSTDSGILTLLLPEEIIGNIETILVDKIPWNYISYAGNTVTVMIPENTKTIEIKGSYRDNLRGEECR